MRPNRTTRRPWLPALALCLALAGGVLFAAAGTTGARLLGRPAATTAAGAERLRVVLPEGHSFGPRRCRGSPLRWTGEGTGPAVSDASVRSNKASPRR